MAVTEICALEPPRRAASGTGPAARRSAAARLSRPVIAAPAASAETARMMAELQAERLRAARICDALAQYVPAHILDRLMADPDGLALGGETRDVTVLFADIRGFSHIAEAMGANPSRLAEVVSAVLEPLTDIVLDHGGVLDKYMGDCVMAFWGAPGVDPDHARRALEAAQAMVAAMPEIDARLRAAFPEAADLPRIEIGVGLNSGPCVVGNMGCRRRWDYSVLGDPVNVASRLQELCKTYGRSVLLGEETARQLGGGVGLVEVDRTAVRGRSQVETIFALGELFAPCPAHA